MRIGGWWRLWLAVSILWIAAVLIISVPTRPEAKQVAEDLGLTCGIASPIAQKAAQNTLELRKLFAALREADRGKNTVEAKRLANNIRALREAWSRELGMPLKYSRFGGENLYADSQPGNRWSSLSPNCLKLLDKQASGVLLAEKRRGWKTATLKLLAIIPVSTLLLGALVGWVWRGFRKQKPGQVKS